eukprot:2905782-Pleurochrysis_carterae.AAC.3
MPCLALLIPEKSNAHRLSTPRTPRRVDRSIDEQTEKAKTAAAHLDTASERRSVRDDDCVVAADLRRKRGRATVAAGTYRRNKGLSATNARANTA